MHGATIKKKKEGTSVNPSSDKDEIERQCNFENL